MNIKKRFLINLKILNKMENHQLKKIEHLYIKYQDI